jgi:hypothetical protein
MDRLWQRVPQCKVSRSRAAGQVVVITLSLEHLNMAQAMASSAVAAAGGAAASRTSKACSSPAVATPRPAQLRRSVLHGQTLRAVTQQSSRSRINTLCRVRVHMLSAVYATTGDKRWACGYVMRQDARFTHRAHIQTPDAC